MGKTKKAGIIARAVTCLAATVAIALGTASPAFAAGEVTDSVDTSNISVTVPTTIPCTMMADGTVVAPSGLSIVNSGDAVVMDAYTADAMGNAVDFTLDIGLGSVLDKFKSLDLSSFDTSNVTNMKGMFDNNVCLELVTLGSRFRFITWGDGAGYLPRQTPDYIPGADGMWYNTAGQGFNPNVVPSYVADTYTAYNPALQRPVSLSESPV